MYSVSADYLTALSQPFHKYKLTGTIDSTAFDEENIITGSLSVSNRVSEGSEIKLGSVYTGELRATFTGLSIARGAWVGKVITLSEGLQLADDSFEYVPIGVFYISEAKHTAQGVEVVAYDAMTKFDKNAAQSKIPDSGTPYNYLVAACDACHVTLGSSQADISALPNGTETLNTFVDNGIDTWRDLIGWVAQTLGGVSTINRSGALEVRQYSMTSAMTIDETQRFTGCEFSDFEANYTGMSAVNMVTYHTVYKSVSPDDGLTYNLGQNPLVQDDFDRVQNIIDDFSTVSLTPFSAQMLGGAIFDLCDCLTFSGGIAAGAVCGVMGYTWQYNGAYSVKGFGENPALATAKSKTEKNLEGLFATVAQEVNQLSVVQNASAVTISENTETSILTYNFEVTQDDNTTLVDVSVVMTATATETLVGDVYTLADLVAKLRFYVDNVQVSVYDPRFIVDEGKDTMTFNYSLSGLSVGPHAFDIRIEMAGGAGSVAVGDVHEMLWGYGITFEVYIKEIEVSQMPDRTTFYVGESLDYTGVGVDAVYNNGLRDDVTAQCAFDPVAGTILDEYDIGELSVDVTYDTFSTEMTLDVVRVQLMLGTQADFPSYGKPVVYNGNPLWVSVSSDSSPVMIVREITFTPDGVPQFTTVETHTFPAYSPGSHEFVQLGSKKVSTAGSKIMVSSVTQPFYYYDFADGTSGSLTATFINVGSANTITDFGNSNSYPAFEVDGCIVWPRVTVKDSGGNTLTGYAVGGLSGTTLTIRFYSGTTLSVPELIYVSRPELEHIDEQKYFYGLTGGVLSLYAWECDGETLSQNTVWSASVAFTGSAYHDFVPVGGKAVLGTWYVEDGDYILDVYVVDVATGTSEHHLSYDRDNDPMYMYYLTTDNSLKQGLYLPRLDKYVVCDRNLHNVKTTTIYLSDDLIDWTEVSGIENDQDKVAQATYPYIPTDTGMLVNAYKNQNFAYSYKSQMRFSNLE